MPKKKDLEERLEAIRKQSQLKTLEAQSKRLEIIENRLKIMDSTLKLETTKTLKAIAELRLELNKQTIGMLHSSITEQKSSLASLYFSIFLSALVGVMGISLCHSGFNQ